MSTFSKVISDLGFKSEIEQIALLHTLKIPGYLSQDNLQRTIDFVFSNYQNKISFAEFDELFEQCGVYEESFDPKKLLKKETKIAEENIRDFLTFCKYKIETEDKSWMIKSKEFFVENAKILGVVDSITLIKKTHYDEVWIQGSSRIGTIYRITTFENLQKQNLVTTNAVKILTGERELWVEMDGIGDSLEEKIADGKKYMLDLAAKNGIEIDRINPFIQKDGRTYLNYSPSETRKVHESHMADDITSQMNSPHSLLLSKAEEGRDRATTASTSMIAALELKSENIKHPKILIVSDQPHVERQRLANYLSILDCGICDATVDAVGEIHEMIGVENINSELIALGLEQYKLFKKKNSSC